MVNTLNGVAPLPPHPRHSKLKLGVNVNPDDPNAHASARRLKGLSCVRVVYKRYIREGRKERPEDEARRHYTQYVHECLAQGVNVLFVLNQETVVPTNGWSQWKDLARWDDNQWNTYIARFAETAAKIAHDFKSINAQRPGSIAYQIWNEGDEQMEHALRKLRERNHNLTLEDAYTLPIDARRYGHLLERTAAAIKSADPKATVVSMGLVSGKESAATYIAQAHFANKGMFDNVDAVAFHPYDCYPTGSEGNFSFADRRSFQDVLANVVGQLRNVKEGRLPIWITEIGAKPRGNEGGNLEQLLASYMRATVHDFAVNHAKVEAVFWFPWADFAGTMEVSQAGLIDRNGVEKPTLWKAYSELVTWLGAGESPVAPTRPTQPVQPVTPQGQLIDVWQYIVGKPGLSHNLRSNSDNQENNETVTTVDLGGGIRRFYKNSQFETIWLADYKGKPYIWRGLDTSPGGGRMYTVWLNGSEGAPWCPRFMRVGEEWEADLNHYVQFYDLASGAILNDRNNGESRNRNRLAAHYARMTFVNNLEIHDVIELGWKGGEHYLYAKDRGLVGWRRDHHDPHTPQQSGVSEIHAPESRPAPQVHLPRYSKPLQTATA